MQIRAFNNDMKCSQIQYDLGQNIRFTPLPQLKCDGEKEIAYLRDIKSCNSLDSRKRNILNPLDYVECYHVFQDKTLEIHFSHISCPNENRITAVPLLSI